MPDPGLQAYLASKYLSGPKADAILARVGGGEDKKKKKKRKREEAAGASGSGGGGLSLVDDDEVRQPTRARNRLGREGYGYDDEGDDLDEAQVVEGPKASKFSRSAFSSVAGLVKKEEPQEDAALADIENPDEAPQIVEGQAHLAQQRAERSKAIQAAKPSAASPAEDELQFQTVYRDASGRKIDIRAEEEARKKAEDAKRRKDEERKTWGMGHKQKADQVAARERLREEAKTSFSRHADDKRMNDTLRSIERTDDPALAFLTKKRDAGPVKPKYKGPAPPPNRFGIAPGYRWDGVDRSTGFERMYFQKLNERKRRNASALAYDQDDL